MQHCRHATMLAKCFFIASTLLLTQPLLSAECADVAQLVSLVGSAEKRTHDQKSWQAAKLNDRFCAGDTLKTLPDSRAAVRLANETLVRLDGSSTLTFSMVEKQSPSLLELLKGALHFISRTPKSMEIKTPYVNASIEGTEFVVNVQDRATEVTVLEGVVITRNDAGSVELSANQASRTNAGQQPVRIEVARPFDAVAWALYYPQLPETPGEADTLAQSAIKSIVRNRLQEAAALAKQAIEKESQSVAAYIAQSYVDQAMFDIPAALSHSQRAAQLAPQSALVQARLAEVWLMTGDTGAARKAAKQATSIDPKLSLAHTVLGFASLQDISLDTAKTAFEEAIALDSSAPLPRLGLGLLKIRQGELQSGREEIETAALLAPNNALLRSYMGKAYYEEKRNELASQQFAMAKEIDPNDPTAWFYESILLQSENRPVEALHAQQHAIKLNNNRGVYRSRQLLDNDEAARNVALGRIYNDLNFEQQARDRATDTLAQDPGNHSAHRLLADSYVGQTNLDAARQSELLQSKMTQPLNLDPLQPQLNNSNLGLLDGNGPEDLSYNEYNPLFTRNGMALQLDASVAQKSTWSNDAIVAGLYDRLAFSVGQYHTETDRLSTSFGYEQDIINGFLQFTLTDRTSIQLEMSENEEDKGDVSQRLLPEFLNNDNIEINDKLTSTRIGLNQSLYDNMQLSVNASRREKDFFSRDTDNQYLIIETDSESTIDLYEAQVTGKQTQTVWLVGISRQTEDFESLVDPIYLPPLFCPISSCATNSTGDTSQNRLYGYLFYELNSALSVTGGISHIREKRDNTDTINKTYPKLGLRLEPKTGNVFRLATFRNRASVIRTSLYETLEPTQIVGFNQLYDDIDLSDSWNYAISYQHRFTNNLQVGIASLYRDLKTTIDIQDSSSIPPTRTTDDIKYDDKYANLWLNWTPSSQWSLGLEYSYSNYNLGKELKSSSSVILAPDGILKLETHKLPLTVNYFHASGITGTLTTTYYDQKGKFVDVSGIIEEGKDQGLITDLAFSYRLSKRLGSVSLGVKNLFDKDLRHEDRNSYDSIDPQSTSSPSSFSGERAVFGKISLNFR